MQNRDREHEMTERDHALAEMIAQHTMDRFLTAAKDEEVAGRVIDTWAGHLQRVVGRAVLRLLMYIALIALGLASIKFGLADKFMEVFRK